MPFKNPISPEAAEAINTAVTERFRHVDNTLKKLQHQLFMRWLIAMMGLIIAGAGIYYAVNKATDTSHQAKTIAIQVVLQRRQTIRSSCEAQNMRHDNTLAQLKSNSQEALTPKRIKALRQELAAIGVNVTPAQARRFEVLSAAQNSATTTLINVLVPRQNCQALVNQQAPLSGTHS